MIAVCSLVLSLGAWLVHAAPACDSRSAGREACPAPDDHSGTEDLSELLQTAVRVRGLKPDDEGKEVGSNLQTEAANAETGPVETVNEFCDTAGIAKMHGYVGENGSLIRGDQEALMEDIMDDVANELTKNNIDAMVKDIFSFYVCVRWVPDEVFWKVAEQELAAEILQSVVEKSESPKQAIGELYQNFKFTPLLCSQNLKVYEERSDKDHTYFTTFREKMMALSTALSGLKSGPVWAKMRKADKLFCGGEYMNSATCDVGHGIADFFNKATSWMGDWGTDFHTKEDKWGMMEDVFKQFTYHATDGSWNADFAKWKNQFPYHSFIAKPEGVPSAHSPSTSQRFLVCFGKRVASELHRRPRGNHIITDQNNIGCHGWWDAAHVADMLQRTVALWKPPTCDIAEMSYVFKKEILKQFMRMNEQLFDALPSMVSDEKLDEEGKLDEAAQGPPPFDVASMTVGGTKYFSGTRVVAANTIKWDVPGSRRRWRCYYNCEVEIKKGHSGSLVITDSSSGNLVPVKWDGQSSPRSTATQLFKVVPHEYGLPVDGILDDVIGWAGGALDSIGDFFKTFWGGQYSSLAHFMSGSIAKWVVCPLAANISLQDLDANLGTEDLIYREFSKEAYSKWTGFKAKLPGEECAKEDDFLDPNSFPSECKVCELSELHENYPEMYFDENGQHDPYMCPIKPPLGAVEQLGVFKDKKEMCVLHMTAKQNRQHQWHYNGHWPARKQNFVQPNVPLPEYELVRILDIGNTAWQKQIAYGRTCTVEEAADNPRFCGLNEIETLWDSIEDMAQAVSKFLHGAVGMPVGAVADLIGNVGQLLKANGTADAAMLLGEQSWEALMGVGRLAHDTVQTVTNDLVYALPGDNKRHARIEAELFGWKHGGDFLHSMSYQKGIGANNYTSNARQRYRRYAVVCPCKSFDPGMELALKYQWAETVLRIFREGLKHNTALLNKPTATVSVRAEAKLFWRTQPQSGENNTWFDYGAGIDAGEPNAPAPVTVTCKKHGSYWKGYQCRPTDHCTLLQHTFSSECVKKQVFPKSTWRVVWDRKLADTLMGGAVSDQDIGVLRALTVTVYCGPKKNFGASGGPTGQTQSLKQCMQNGVKANAAMKSEKPWKVYFPDEVIVVAVFGTIPNSKCISVSSQTRGKVCAGAEHQDGLDSHLGNVDKSSYGGVYHGLTTGSGSPKGILKEVVLRPEDILEVTGLLF